MIDPATEALIPLREVPAHVEKKYGRKINIATIYRYRNVGCAGIRWEVCYVLGKPFTSLEAIARFDVKVTAARVVSIAEARPATPKQVSRAHAAAMQKLAGAK